MKNNSVFVTSLFVFLLVFTAREAVSQPISQHSFKIGFYSGSFDPPHKSHLEVIEDSFRELKLDFMIVIPNVSAVHKPNISPFEYRREMVRTAFKTVPHLFIAPPRYVKVAENLNIRDVFLQMGLDFPNSEIFQIMGDDSFERLKQIADKRMPRNGSIAVRQREGATTTFPETYQGMKVYTLPPARSSISSTAIRNAVQAGQQPKGVTTEVYELIRQWDLYSGRPCDSILTVFPLGGKKKSNGRKKN